MPRKPTIAEKEKRLVIAAQAGDVKAMGELIEMHRGFIWKCVHAVRGKRLDPDDLFQAGAYRFLMAVRGWKPEKKMRLLTYVGMSVQREMWDYARKEKRRRGRAASLTRVDFDGNEVQHCLAIECDPTEQAERNEEIQTITGAIEQLNPRYRDILRRRMNDERLLDIAPDYGVTKERVRQIEMQAKNQILELLGA